MKGCTALHLAAYRGHPSSCRALLEKGASIDALTLYGDTPLHMAAQSRGNRRTVESLLKHGASTRIKATSGQHEGLTAVQVAWSLGHEEIVKLFSGF